MHVRAGVVGDPELRTPKVVLPLAATEPFHDSLRTVTVEPVPDRTPPHSWVTLWPPGQVQFTVQPLIGEVPARTATSPCQPPDQELTTRIVAEHAPVGTGVGVGVGVGLGEEVLWNCVMNRHVSAGSQVLGLRPVAPSEGAGL